MGFRGGLVRKGPKNYSKWSSRIENWYRESQRGKMTRSLAKF